MDGDAIHDDSPAGLAGRVRRLEEAVAELRGERAAPDSQRTLENVASALQDLAQRAGEPLLFFASASARWATASGPERLEGVAQDDQLPAIVALAQLFADELRVKLLQALLVETGCSMTRLAGLTGQTEDVLRADLATLASAGLVSQPEPGNYELAPAGEQAVAMVFWAAWRTGAGAPAAL